MRWLIATDDFWPLDGGVATWTALVAEGLSKHDEVVVLARNRAGLPLRVGQARVVGVRGPSFGRHGGAWTAIAAVPLLPRVDRILATTWPVADPLIALADRIGVPLDVAFHGSDLTRPIRAQARFERVCRRARRRLCVSRFLADRLALRGFGAEVIPAAVHPGPPRLPSRCDRPRRWVFVGRATGLKGGDRFVRMAAAAGAEAVVYGDGPELARWTALADRLGADVRFEGHRPHSELVAALPGFDLAVLVPRQEAGGSGAEGLGLVLVEAASAGVAVVGCRVGGVPEATGAGLILDDPDDIERSVSAIVEWWNPGRGEACRRHVAAHHGVERLIRHLRDA